MKLHHIRFTLLFMTLFSYAQMNTAQSGKILHELQKFDQVGTVLYVAAHPDDENTRLISYFSNHEKLRTVYLSLTRGDGGQNLMGPDLREKLGLIRTHELLAARSIDGGSQFFSRANDFGYSKSPEETLEIWNKEEVLADVVWAIRVHKPDIIVNRFNHEIRRRTHGHHTASAMLSVEAFDLAGDSSAFPEQLQYVDVWQPKRIYFNTSWWFYGSREAFSEADKSNMAAIDVGQYYPLLGLSNNEISAASRSMHKCQGFGSATGRGSYFEFLDFIKGERPENKDDVLEGIPTDWTRLENGEEIEMLMNEVLGDFDPSDPSQSIPALLTIRKKIRSLPSDHWREIKLEQLDKIIRDCAGLFIRASADQPTICQGEKLDWELEVTNRSGAQIKLDKLESPQFAMDTSLNQELPNNQEQILSLTSQAQALPTSTPYWLQEEGEMGMYKVSSQLQRGQPLGAPPVGIEVQLDWNGELMNVFTPLTYVRVDPVKGELSDPVKVVPEISVTFTQGHTLFKPNETKKLSIQITAHRDIDSAIVAFNSLNDWLVQLEEQELSLRKGQTINQEITVTAPGLPDQVQLQATVRTAFGEYNKGIRTISYEHIPDEQIEVPAFTALKCIDLKTAGVRIGYIEGAGDEVAEGLRSVGYLVENVSAESMTAADLRRYDAVVVGIRAFNTNDALAQTNTELFNYAENGGVVLVQYNTRHRLATQEIAPGLLELSRLRVTDELSPVTILDDEHPVLNYPNKINLQDFDGWVQERGLYFPEKWSTDFTPILSMSDPGEEELKGALLVGEFGQGYYVYSPLSYFRQLPSGVSGAYRLLANIIALNQNTRP